MSPNPTDLAEVKADMLLAQFNDHVAADYGTHHSFGELYERQAQLNGTVVR